MEFKNFSSTDKFFYKRFNALGLPAGGIETAVTGFRYHSQPTTVSTDSDYRNPTRWGYRFNKDTGLFLQTEAINIVDGSSEQSEGFCNALTVSVPHTDLKNRVRKSALDQALSNLRGDVDLSIDIAQYKQTKELFRFDRLAARVLQVARDVKKLHGKRALKGIGGLWLEAQYGVLPTISTAFALAQPLLNPSDGAFMTAKGKRKVSDSYLSDNISTLPVSGTRYSIKEKRLIEYSERCEVKLVIRNPAIMSLENIGRYTSLNPASIAWELLPFSFVADWFWDLGGLLRNAETSWLYASLFHSGYYTYTSVHKEKTSTCKITPTTGNLLKKKIFRPGTSLSVNVERYPYTVMPLPRLPPVKVSLGSHRLLNAAALLSQFLKR